MLYKCSLLCLLCWSGPMCSNAIKLESDFFVHQMNLIFPIEFFFDSSCKKLAFELRLDEGRFHSAQIKEGQFYVQDGTKSIHEVLVARDDELFRIDTKEMIDLDENLYTQDAGIINAVPEEYCTPVDEVKQIRNLLLSLGYDDKPTILVLKDTAEVAILIYKNGEAYISLNEELELGAQTILLLQIQNKVGIKFSIELIKDDNGQIKFKV